MATIYDVSKRAGVSASTVSRVLNNNPQVAPELRQLVMDAVNAMNFVPSGTARSLKTKRTERIALVIPDINNPFFPEMAHGVQDACEARGYHLILSNTDDDPERESRYLKMLAKVGVDGLIITPSVPGTNRRAAEKRLEQDLLMLQVPVVGIFVAPVTPQADQICVDEDLTGFRATEHLLALGHTRIGLLQGEANSAVTELRRAGFLRALNAHGLTPNPVWMLNGHARREGGHAAMQQLLALSDRPSAVFAINDVMALGALAAAHEANLRVPEDIAVIGVDNIAESATSYPPLSTVAMPNNYDQGYTAAQVLLERIHAPNKNASRRTIVFETQLVVRASTVSEQAKVSSRSSSEL